MPPTHTFAILIAHYNDQCPEPDTQNTHTHTHTLHSTYPCTGRKLPQNIKFAHSLIRWTRVTHASSFGLVYELTTFISLSHVCRGRTFDTTIAPLGVHAMRRHTRLASVSRDVHKCVTRGRHHPASDTERMVSDDTTTLNEFPLKVCPAQTFISRRWVKSLNVNESARE